MKVLCKIFDPSYRDKTAIINTVTDDEISYGYLFQRVNDLRLKIEEEYFGDKPILLFAEGKICYIIGLFAILSAGKIPILVNSKLKQELKHCADLYDILITSDSNYRHLKKFSDTSNKKGLFIDPNDYIEEKEYEYSSITMKEDDIFCYLFTSGSTGDSYLVKKTISNLMMEIETLIDLFNIDEGDVFLSLVPDFHIYGLLFSILLPLSMGAKLRQDIPLFSPKMIIEEGFLKKSTVIITNPMHLTAISDLINDYDKKDFQHIKQCISSTANLSEELNLKLFEKWGLKISEVYGTTESGGIGYRKLYENTYWKFFPQIEWRLDEGVLEIQSSLMSPLEKNDRHLCKDGWFITGDVVEVIEEGFSLLGRTNQIVKVDGHRVSALEVEEVLKHFYEIEDVALIGIEDNNGNGEALKAYVVPFDFDNKRFISDLKKYCNEKLAPFKVPKEFIVVESIPRDLNGKVQFQLIELPY